MKKTVLAFLLAVICFNAMADDFAMDAALRATYENCVGIDESLHDMKVLAGINTAVSGVGTGLGIGATAVGIAKKNVDAEIEQKFKTLEALCYSASGETEVATEEEFLEAYGDALRAKTAVNNDDIKKSDAAEEIRELTEKSKKLGNWRTGLLAGNTATNVAGAVISGTNKVKQPLREQIQNCISSVRNLSTAIMQAKINGEDVSEAVQIESACKEFEYVDVAKINDMATGGMVSSIVGSGTGVAGTIASVLANSDKVRAEDNNKEKNLNTAANVLAAGSTVASATATVFNASQIKAIKDVARVAENCTEVLK
ncbi:MAG: hypothetical protein J6W40_05290 [Alphaproteobacteria bacterium]|nr:hypothetical protein [Alphaproteobacteria bacterium]